MLVSLGSSVAHALSASVLPSCPLSHPLGAEICLGLFPGCQKALVKGKGAVSLALFLLAMDYEGGQLVQQVPLILPISACHLFSVCVNDHEQDPHNCEDMRSHIHSATNSFISAIPMIVKSGHT